VEKVGGRGSCSESPQGLRDIAEGKVLSDLRKDMPHLMPQETKAIFKFYVHLNAIKLKLLPDSIGNAEGSKEFVNFA
jgi:hypothetical protein